MSGTDSITPPPFPEKTPLTMPGEPVTEKIVIPGPPTPTVAPSSSGISVRGGGHVPFDTKSEPEEWPSARSRQRHPSRLACCGASRSSDRGRWHLGRRSPAAEPGNLLGHELAGGRTRLAVRLEDRKWGIAFRRLGRCFFDSRRGWDRDRGEGLDALCHQCEREPGGCDAYPFDHRDAKRQDHHERPTTRRHRRGARVKGR